MAERIELSREQLYAAVWTRPIAIAAAELGMTSEMLKRSCRVRSAIAVARALAKEPRAARA
jgi:hypothetical protein